MYFSDFSFLLSCFSTRYDIQVVGGIENQVFPEMDARVPTVSIILRPGRDVRIHVRGHTGTQAYILNIFRRYHPHGSSALPRTLNI